ncbi:MAG: hypothetical protein JWO59_1610 [Chloroflexi bacterium]|nr:hypothetical protein [Chloroflexota bacterium]
MTVHLLRVRERLPLCPGGGSRSACVEGNCTLKIAILLPHYSVELARKAGNWVDLAYIQPVFAVLLEDATRESTEQAPKFTVNNARQGIPLSRRRSRCSTLRADLNRR